MLQVHGTRPGHLHCIPSSPVGCGESAEPRSQEHRYQGRSSEPSQPVWQLRPTRALCGLGSLCFSFHPWWTHSEAPSAEGQRVPGFPTAELTGGQVGWMADKQPLSGRWGAAQCLLHGCCYFFFPTLPTDGRQPVPACKLLLPLPRTEQANPESGLQQQHIYTMAGTINKPGSELPAAPAPPAVPPS